jgi:regulator of nucleoside diphosphate kinase
MSKPQAAPKRPPIFVIASEADALTDLALAAEARAPQAAQLLLSELERARACPPARLPSDVVTMHSFVEFVDERSGQPRTVQLVYPAAADAAAQRISVLTPIGAALIGMRAGSSISWPDRSGTARPLRILSVQQPEPACGA